MKSNKQKRSEISARKAAKREKQEILAVQAAREARLEFRRLARSRGELPVDTAKLSPNNSYSIPAFVARGTYAPIEFACKQCGKVETWTAEQQKWWYEVAKGDVFTTAIMCRPCRRKERSRRDEARRTHLDGAARKLPARKG
ncbi:zinc-ribbon domain containing protein [Bradyrhizobium jicamae]|uniref:zinc-ribbon domain containing protein n=1 Tax=Bradyrhizobium jicamae TaxID=280332 RepID=UPI001BA4ADB8|nr:zinc-ribbon domain containing protein [Bradyrhizobium jicamae]MBR0937264.1 zinc-ribbon domain containing protein [Bradyrhizobium jicamae]